MFAQFDARIVISFVGRRYLRISHQPKRPLVLVEDRPLLHDVHEAHTAAKRLLPLQKQIAMQKTTTRQTHNFRESDEAVLLASPLPRFVDTNHPGLPISTKQVRHRSPNIRQALRRSKNEHRRFLAHNLPHWTRTQPHRRNMGPRILTRRSYSMTIREVLKTIREGVMNLMDRSKKSSRSLCQVTLMAHQLASDSKSLTGRKLQKWSE